MINVNIVLILVDYRINKEDVLVKSDSTMLELLSVNVI